MNVKHFKEFLTLLPSVAGMGSTNPVTPTGDTENRWMGFLDLQWFLGLDPLATQSWGRPLT